MGRGGSAGAPRRAQQEQAPLSPTAPESGLIRKESCSSKRKRNEEAKKKEERKGKKSKDSVKEVESKNSDDFPTQDRPEMFQEDAKFNKLSYETAAKICWEYKQLKDQKESKERKNGSLERADDKLPLVKIPAGEDDARNIFCEARKKLRPPVVEMKKTMEWYPTKWEQIVRNLPLGIYSLDDSVNSKAVELCHNL